MKNAAKVLPGVLVVIVAVGALVVTGWWATAQEGATSPQPEGTSGTDSTADGSAAVGEGTQYTAKILEGLRVQAEQAMAAGQYELATAQFLEAASAFTQANRAAEAVQLYDQAASAAKEFLISLDLSRWKDGQSAKLDSAKGNLRRALLGKTGLCRGAGDTQGTLRAIQQLRAEDPEYYRLREILPLQAELQGVDLAVLRAQEADAAQLSDQAKWAWKQGNSKSAGELADAAITQYPDTAGALLARKTKAGMLWRLKQYPEARTLYEDIMNRVGTIAPTCAVAREAASRIGWLESIRQIRQCMALCKEGRRPSVAQWKAAQEQVLTVMRWDQEAGTRAEAEVMQIEIYSWQGMSDEVIKHAAEFWGRYGDGSAAAIKTLHFERASAWAHVYVGRAFQSQGRWAEARAHFQAVIDAHTGKPDSWLAPDSLAAAYWYIWHGLRQSGGPAEEIRSIGDQIVTRFSNSSHAAIVRRAQTNARQ